MDPRNSLRLTLLGNFSVFWGEKQIHRFETTKTQALLAYLAMEQSKTLNKETIADLFWGEMPPRNSLRNLRLTTHRLKVAFQNEAKDNTALNILLSQRNIVQLDPSLRLWIDAVEFERILQGCFSHPHVDISQCQSCADQIEKATLLYRGNFLDGLQINASIQFDEWLVVYREKYFRLMIDALSILAKHYLNRAGMSTVRVERQLFYEKSLTLSRQIIQMEPWNEPAHQMIMEALAQTDRIVDVVTQYRLCCHILAEEFNLEPGLATTQLFQELTANHKANTTLLIPRHVKGNIRPASTPFVDRQMQVEKLRKLLFLYRWITLVGEGGIGKTRLAQHAAQGLESRFDGGIWMIPLDDQNNEGLSRKEMLTRLSQALLTHIPFLAGSAELPPAQIISQIGTQSMLIILDGFEEFSGSADTILDLLTNAPNLRVIVTTRHMIYFQAGYVMRVDGLAVPDQVDDPQADHSPAVELFIERADRCGSTINLNRDNLAHIIHICNLLDGVPLAIELAAPLTLRHSLSEIAAMLQQDLSLLSSRFSDFPKRHSSMETVFEHSWKLLTLQERALLSMCADLPPEFTITELQPSKPCTQDEIDQLVDKSLLARIFPGKYKMHQTLRLFVKSKCCLAVLEE